MTSAETAQTSRTIEALEARAAANVIPAPSLDERREAARRAYISEQAERRESCGEVVRRIDGR